MIFGKRQKSVDENYRACKQRRSNLSRCILDGMKSEPSPIAITCGLDRGLVGSPKGEGDPRPPGEAGRSPPLNEGGES